MLGLTLLSLKIVGILVLVLSRFHSFLVPTEQGCGFSPR